MACLNSPLLVGIYCEKSLIQTIQKDEKCSDALPKILAQIGSEFEINSIIYANGPGSFMGIKLSYIILKTYCIAKNIPFFAICGFALSPVIRANAHFSFILENGKITQKSGLENLPLNLPKTLTNLAISQDTAPNYVLEAL